MPIITETELRERVRQPQHGMKLTLHQGTMFSPSAADFIKQWHIEVDYIAAPPAKVEKTMQPTPVDTEEAGGKPGWETPSVFPVNFSGEMPHCITCGTALEHKPEHMTQLNKTLFAPKNNARIRLRGKLDTLQAVCLMIAKMAQENGADWLTARLDTLAAYCREMTSAEYNERRVEPLEIDGLDEAALRKVTHNPSEFLGIPHLTPGADDPLVLLWLNYLRSQVREAELAALDVFECNPGDKDPLGLVQAMNRMSSAVYYLELLMVKSEAQTEQAAE